MLGACPFRIRQGRAGCFDNLLAFLNCALFYVLLHNGVMTEDQILRGALTAASIPIYVYLIQKSKAYLSAARNKTGRDLPERLGHRLGIIWSRANKTPK